MKCRPFLGFLSFGLWLATAGASYLFLLRYKSIPGTQGKAATAWPSASHLQLDGARPTLVMLAHPRCPCTAASLDELARLLSHYPRRVAAHVLFLVPDGCADSWEREGLWQRARASAALVSADRMGREAELFGATTSGHVLLYGPDGRLLFSGGITGARGHAGDNLGLDRLRALLDGGEASQSAVPVFGCPLQSPCQACVKEGP
jgi:hypothetical protein